MARRLEGRLVTLEPLRADHEDPMWRAAEDAGVWRWMTTNAAESRAAFAEWFRLALQHAREGTEVPFAVLAAADQQPAGSTRYLALRPEHRGLEIGYTWLGRQLWNTGANAEAKLLLLEHAFERLGCMRVEFKTDARNERARRALEALPAKFEGIFRKHMLVRDGDVRDSAWYAVIDDDWPDVKSALRARVDTHVDQRTDPRAPDGSS